MSKCTSGVARLLGTSDPAAQNHEKCTFFPHEIAHRASIVRRKAVRNDNLEPTPLVRFLKVPPQHVPFGAAVTLNHRS